MKTYRPIYAMTFFACFCMGVHWSGAEEVSRVFNSADGRCITGKLTGYHPEEEIVTITRNDGNKFRVSLALFSKTDQQYIREQSAELDFRDSIMITPMLREFDTAGSHADTRDKMEHVKSLGYIVSLKNNSPSRFEKIEIEYCLFYRQGERLGNRMEFLCGVQRGRWALRSMQPGSEHVLKTEKVLIYDSDATCTTSFGNSSRFRGEVDGVWLRVTATLPTGARVFREYQSASLTRKCHTWAATSIPVGLNKI